MTGEEQDGTGRDGRCISSSTPTRAVFPYASSYRMIDSASEYVIRMRTAAPGDIVEITRRGSPAGQTGG